MLKGFNTSIQVKEIIDKWNKSTDKNNNKTVYTNKLNEKNKNKIENEFEEQYHKELKEIYPLDYEEFYKSTINNISNNKVKKTEENLHNGFHNNNGHSNEQKYISCHSNINCLLNNSNHSLNHKHTNNDDLKISYTNTQNFSNIFTCHEGLLLNYESALTRKNPNNNKYYNLTAEMLWIGERTNNINEAHIEYFRGVVNPIGVKVSCRTNIDDYISLLQILNPENIMGKVFVITRVGNSIKGKNYLENLIQRIKIYKINCVFLCDPMHGNTEMIGGHKTRKLSNLIQEINFTIKMLSANDLTLNGLHFESTPFDVSECVGENDLEVNPDRYTTMCDPRLNLKQVLKILESIKDLED